MRDESIKSVFEDHGGNIRRRTCMLMVTHKCNLNCSYCYETHKDDQEMSFEMAKRILREEFDFVQKSDAFEELEIDFMGGEPLMNFSLIKQIVEWLECEPPPVPYICFATTNGTLLDEARKHWIRTHRDRLWLGASYDGANDIQKINRGADGNLVDYAFFQECWPLQGFKVTISKEGLPSLCADIIASHKRGFRLSASLAQGVDWDDADAELYAAQLEQLSEYYLEHPDIEPVNLLTRYIPASVSEENKQCKFCGTGTHMQTYDTDGRRYGCHMFTPIVVGHGQEITTEQIDWSDPDIADDKACCTCILKRFCPTCMGFNYKCRHSLGTRDKRWCKMILAEAMAVCTFQIRRLAQCEKLMTSRDAAFAKSALIMVDKLENFKLSKSVPPFCISCKTQGKGGEYYEN